MSETKNIIEEINYITKDWVNKDLDTLTSNDFYTFFIDWARSIRKVPTDQSYGNWCYCILYCLH